MSSDKSEGGGESDDQDIGVEELKCFTIPNAELVLNEMKHSICHFLLFCSAAGTVVAQEPLPHLVNRMLESKLPGGNGIAATFDSDEGIEEHAAVIFADGFEGGEDW